MTNIFKPDDIVDFVNDYGVIFPNKVITEVELTSEGYRYQIENNDTPWFLKYEKNLHLAGTYQKPSLDIELNNGIIAKFSHYDYWDRKIFIIARDEESFKAVLLDDSEFYSITGSFGEPAYPLKKEFQGKEI